MNGPNILTLLRVCLIPILVIVLLSSWNNKDLIAISVFLLAALTDLLDGLWARKKKQITAFGELLDPVADKLLIASAFICLVEMERVPAWMVVIIIGREIAVMGFRAIASSKGIQIPASIFGKIKMNAETFTIALLILGSGYLGKYILIAQIGLWISVAAAIVSAVEYIVKFGARVVGKS